LTRVTSVTEEKDSSLWIIFRVWLVPWISPHWLLKLTIWGCFLSGPDVQHRPPFHSTSLRVRSSALQPPSIIWKETPESPCGCALPSSRDRPSPLPPPSRLQSQGAMTHYPQGLHGLISLGPPRKCCRKNNGPVRRDSKPDAWRKGIFIYASGSAAGSLLKGQHWPFSSGLLGFYASECGSKQAGRTRADGAVSLLLGGYNVSH
jgi:hypothetical protein